MKHFMCTHTFHSSQTREQFFKIYKGKTSRDWFSPINDSQVKCLSTWVGEQDFWFCHWVAEKEELIHEKLESLKGDRLFLTLAQEMQHFVTTSEPETVFIGE